MVVRTPLKKYFSVHSIAPVEVWSALLTIRSWNLAVIKGIKLAYLYIVIADDKVSIIMNSTVGYSQFIRTG